MGLRRILVAGTDVGKNRVSAKGYLKDRSQG